MEVAKGVQERSAVEPAGQPAAQPQGVHEDAPSAENVPAGQSVALRELKGQ